MQNSLFQVFKLASTCHLKRLHNFIHSHKCEEWNVNNIIRVLINVIEIRTCTISLLTDNLHTELNNFFENISPVNDNCNGLTDIFTDNNTHYIFIVTALLSGLHSNHFPIN